MNTYYTFTVTIDGADLPTAQAVRDEFAQVAQDLRDSGDLDGVNLDGVEFDIGGLDPHPPEVA